MAGVTIAVTVRNVSRSSLTICMWIEIPETPSNVKSIPGSKAEPCS